MLFAYVTLHLLNHALGLISLDAMEAGRRVMLALWRNPAGTLALYLSLFGHVLTSLFRIYERRTLRMQAWELVQIRQALAAAKAMAFALERLNRELAQELAEPLRMGIGIHTGSAIVGELGFGPATSLTAIGDAVNMASRLESKTAEFGVQLVVSTAVEERAGVELAGFPQQEVPIRGRNEKVTVRMVADARELPVKAPEPVEPRGRGRAGPRPVPAA